MKTYRIIAICDPYNARMHYNGEKVLKYDGNTPVVWEMEHGLSLDEAKKILWGYACQDADRCCDLHREDENSIRTFANDIAEDQGIPVEEAMKSFDWFSGEGIYTVENDLMLAKGGTAYSFDVMTYSIEEEEESTTKEINTLEEFRDLINASDDWEEGFNQIIEENGWQDNTGDQYGICADGERTLEFNENGEAVIR